MWLIYWKKTVPWRSPEQVSCTMLWIATQYSIIVFVY
jgi:hypothetical protein